MTDSRPACDERLVGGSFRPPSAQDLRTRDPCKYCFPDGEMNVDEDDLLVGEHTDKRSSIHRHERTGELAWQHNSGPKLAYALQDPEVSDPSDLDWSEIRGGDA